MYATRKVSLPQTLGAGLWLDVLSLVLVVLFCRVLGGVCSLKILL